MKVLAALLAGLALGTTGTALAAQSYWQQRGPDYVCRGVTAGVICRSGGSEVGITHDYLYVARGTQMYACHKCQAFERCARYPT
jgi:hypothetical protein